MPPLVFCRKSDGSFVPAGAASRIVLKIKLGPVCKAERIPTPEDVRSLSSKKLQARECSLLRTLLIQNALGTLNETNNLGLAPPPPVPAVPAAPCDADVDVDEDLVDIGADDCDGLNSDGERDADPLDDSGVFEMDSDDQDADDGSAPCNDENSHCGNGVVPTVPSPHHKKQSSLKRRTVRINAASDSDPREHSPSKRSRQCGRDAAILGCELQSIIGCV